MSEFCAAEVASWLQHEFVSDASIDSVQLASYCAAIVEQNIDGVTLSSLKRDDLAELSVASAVHRAKIHLRWCARVRADDAATAAMVACLPSPHSIQHPGGVGGDGGAVAAAAAAATNGDGPPRANPLAGLVDPVREAAAAAVAAAAAAAAAANGPAAAAATAAAAAWQLGPALPLAHAARALRGVVPHIEAYAARAVAFARARGLPEQHGVPLQLCAALHLYTLSWPVGEESLYVQLNAALRASAEEQEEEEEEEVGKAAAGEVGYGGALGGSSGGFVPPPPPPAGHAWVWQLRLSPFLPYLRLLLGATAALPRFAGRVWRGVARALGPRYPRGARRRWWAVSSCTVDSAVLAREEAFLVCPLALSRLTTAVQLWYSCAFSFFDLLTTNFSTCFRSRFSSFLLFVINTGQGWQPHAVLA